MHDAQKNVEAIRRIKVILDESFQPSFPLDELQNMYISVKSDMVSPERLSKIKDRLENLSGSDISKSLATDLHLYKKAIEKTYSTLN